MIKLELTEKPAELTPELEAELTAEYMGQETAVWKKDFIAKAVFNMSFGKCVYSESSLGKEGKYMEIDHFYPKATYPEKVVLWGNLMASNKKCNGTKGDWDTENEPIINPFEDNPKEHLYIRNYFFFPKTDKGKNTIEATSLNDNEHFVDVRFEIGKQVMKTVADIWRQIEEDITGFFNVRGRKKRVIRNYKSLLKEGNRTSAYAATVSTVLLEDDNFSNICNFLQQHQLWDAELDELIGELEFCALLK